MNIFITRLNGWGYDDTAQYAQVMTAKIGHQLGFKEMAIYGYREYGESDDALNSRLDGIISGVSQGDVVFFQYPTWNGNRYDEALVRKLEGYGCHIIFFIHDIGAFMDEGRRGELDSTVRILNHGKVLIAATSQLKDRLIENGVRAEIPFIIQEIWDYPTEMDFSFKKPKFRKEILFAGTPDKFSFVNDWNYDIPLVLYSSSECSGKNVIRKDWMEQHLLLMDMADGGFGLVWHAHELWREYMKYNCTMKLSSYLAAGIPVIIPRGLSNQKLIEDNHLGFAVDSLEEAVDRVKNMTGEEYASYIDNCKDFAVLMREGFFTRKVFVDSIQALFRNDYMDRHLYKLD